MLLVVLVVVVVVVPRRLSNGRRLLGEKLAECLFRQEVSHVALIRLTNQRSNTKSSRSVKTSGRRL